MKAKYIQSSGRAIAVLLLSGGLLCSGPTGLRAAELQVQTVQTERMAVSGTIIDDSGLPVIGAGIFEKGTTNGTVTDIDGRFSITVNENAVLSISCVGYVTQEVQTAPGQTSLDIVLEQDSEMLEEVVLIGYGETTRKNFTGSVATVDMENSPISMISSSNIYNILNGTAAGVYITSSGEAGGTPSIQIRGQRSIGSTPADFPVTRFTLRTPPSREPT